MPTDVRGVEVVHRLAPQPESLPEARRLARSAAAPHMEDSQIGNLDLAVTEIVSNALAAHRRIGSDAVVRIEIAIGDRFEVFVSDRGEGLDPDSLAEDSTADDPGLGLLITRALVDDLWVDARSGGGSTVAIAVAREQQGASTSA